MPVPINMFMPPPPPPAFFQQMSQQQNSQQMNSQQMTGGPSNRMQQMGPGGRNKQPPRYNRNFAGRNQGSAAMGVGSAGSSQLSQGLSQPGLSQMSLGLQSQDMTQFSQGYHQSMSFSGQPVALGQNGLSQAEMLSQESFYIEDMQSQGDVLLSQDSSGIPMQSGGGGGPNGVGGGSGGAGAPDRSYLSFNSQF
ncbi:uncharacterized protein LOC142337298 [Convolutriloba macropyga]|uniref:uncharacterized protein LOC142337298 n=1 Tax=Convolutriloba macropyga TaxID=536237 RepID=UPI003F51D3AB